MRTLVPKYPQLAGIQASVILCQLLAHFEQIHSEPVNSLVGPCKGSRNLRQVLEDHNRDFGGTQPVNTRRGKISRCRPEKTSWKQQKEAIFCIRKSSKRQRRRREAERFPLRVVKIDGQLWANIE